MSIPVAVGDLAETIAGFGPAYLLTSDAGGRVKAVSALPSLVDGVLRCEHPGRGSTANAALHPEVTMLWPPREAGGHSLLVDGTAEIDGDAVLVSPQSAVLHRPAS